MFRYTMHFEDGSEAGDAAYVDNVTPGDELMLGPGKFVRVLDVVPIENVEGSPYVARLTGTWPDWPGRLVTRACCTQEVFR
jgi:hypothetical protein